MASSYFALLYAWTPLFSWSRALRRWHPVTRTSNERVAAAIAENRTLRFILYLVSFESPTSCRRLGCFKSTLGQKPSRSDCKSFTPFGKSYRENPGQWEGP